MAWIHQIIFYNTTSENVITLLGKRADDIAKTYQSIVGQPIIVGVPALLFDDQEIEKGAVALPVDTQDIAPNILSEAIDHHLSEDVDIVLPFWES